VAGRDAIVVDDGIATGATVRAALMALRERRPARIILAVPVAARDTLEELQPLVDDIVCPLVPDMFRAVGLHYRDFAQTSDDSVRRAMQATSPG
jgi:putative phosphoribosyl transferase